MLSACFQERNAGREEVRIPQEGEDTTEDDDANAGREAQVGKSGERLEQELGWRKQSRPGPGRRGPVPELLSLARRWPLRREAASNHPGDWYYLHPTDPSVPGQAMSRIHLCPQRAA